MDLFTLDDMNDALEEQGFTSEISYDTVRKVFTVIAHKGSWTGSRSFHESTDERSHIVCNMERYRVIDDILMEYKQAEKEQEMKDNKQTFTRDDLKPGYIVQLRDGSFHSIQMVGRETLITIGKRDYHDWKYLSRYWDHYLYYKDHGGKTFPFPTPDKSKDIVAVYGYVQGTENYANCGDISSDNRPLLWSRHEVKKMTVEEIENVLGYKVEIVSDK